MKTHNYTNVTLEEREGVGIIYLSTPRKERNRIDGTLLSDLEQALDQYERAAVRGVVLTSKQTVFSHGAKIEMMLDKNPDEALQAIDRFQDSIRKLKTYAKPVVAALTGNTLGGGLELALACDYIVSSDGKRAVIGLPECRLGILPGMGGTYHIAKRAGIRAVNLVTNATMLSPKEANDARVIDCYVPHDDLMDRAIDIAKHMSDRQPRTLLSVSVSEDAARKKLAEHLQRIGPLRVINPEIGPMGAALARRIIEMQCGITLSDALVYERVALAMCLETYDGQEGIRAMVEKRPPVFEAR